MLDTVGHYKILDRIGVGGRGEVYRARDTRLGRTVAIRVLSPDIGNNPAHRERFLHEARATAALSHPNIAALYEIGEERNRVFLVFEFVAGETLKAVIGGRPLNPRRALDIAIQVADALAEAHAEGIVHHAIKPDNIRATPKGNAKILDFGLAGWTGGGAACEPAATTMTRGAGTALETLTYMSPEQARGEAVDYRTDIFSLGMVLFEMLTGKLPFSATTPPGLAAQIIHAEPPAPSALNPSVPRGLDPIVLKSLVKDRDRRYEAAATFAAELRVAAAILETRAVAADPIPVRKTAVSRRGHRWSMIIAVTLAALAVAGWTARVSIAKLWNDISTTLHRDQARP